MCEFGMLNCVYGFGWINRAACGKRFSGVGSRSIMRLRRTTPRAAEFGIPLREREFVTQSVPQLEQIIEKFWVSFGDAARIAEAQPRVLQTGDRESHRNTMVVVGLYHACVEP